MVTNHPSKLYKTVKLMAIEPEPVDPKIVAEFDKMQATWPKKK